jgi:esterase
VPLPKLGRREAPRRGWTPRRRTSARDPCNSRIAWHTSRVLPSFTKVASGDPERWIVFLHGILGRGNNWRGIARQLIAARPRYGAVLVDLRAHGESQHLAPPDSLERAADDVAKLIETLGPCAVLGHSFGGKVATQLIGRAPVSPVFVVDSLPGARPDRRGSDQTVRVIEMLSSLPDRFETREAFLDHVRGHRYGDAIAKWLAMNLTREGEEFRFDLDMTRIRALLDDYFVRDLWPLLDPPPPGTEVHLVIGGRSSVYGEDDRARAHEIAARHPEAVRVHVLEKADHWVHVDDPEGLLAILEAAL